MIVVRRALIIVVFALLLMPSAFAQDREADLRAQFPYDKMSAQIPGLKVEDYETAIHLLAQMPDLVASVRNLPIHPLTASASTTMQPSSVLSLYNPPPLRPAVPPVPRIGYPTTRGTYEWEAAHLHPPHR